MNHIITHKIHFLWPLMLLAACADSDLDTKDTLSGDGVKTPLAVTALLDASAPSVKSRAADKTFADGDQMVAYLRHVTWNGGFTTDDADARTPVPADQAPRLVTFTCTGSESWGKSITDIYPFDTHRDITVNSDNSQQAAGLTASYTSTSSATVAALYWDDFSSSESADKDLRTTGHYLQSYYGYCYNGGTPSTALGADDDHKVEDGVIGWTILTDQSGIEVPTNFQKSDLLWSAEQTPVSYAHSDKVNGNRPGLVIPFTHAMSKVTINVTAGTGFASDYDFAGTAITLNDVRTTCTATAPTATLQFVADGSDKEDVTMQPQAITTTGTRAFSAIVVPSVLTVGNTLATITGMDGNTYTIPVTEAIVDATTGWGSQLTAAKEDVNHGTAQSRPRRTNDASIPAGSGHQMKSGVHYVLNVTLNKTSVNVSAVIVDWDEIEAEGVGEIHFANDIKDTGNIVEALRANGFDVYKSADKAGFGTAATTMRWNKTASVWKYYPTIYWQGGTTEYFRALSGARPDVETTPANESLTMENNRDVLWGTTEAHSGKDADGADYNYKEGDPLKPRTGDVPLVFYHPMSKITVNLLNRYTDADVPAGVNKDDYTDPRNPLLDLAGARIQISNLKLTGIIALADGAITPTGDAANLFFSERYAANDPSASTPQVKDYVVIPQTIPDASIVTITLADGSIYKVQLNKCNVQGSSTAITAWQRGKHYVYDIYLSKEAITFRALVKDWEEAKGSGNATLEWD